MAIAASASLLLLAGCAGSEGAEERPDVTPDTALSAVDIESLDEHRTPYLGDNSRVAALVNATSADAVGDLTLELHTDHRPYELVLTFSSVTPGMTADVAGDLLTDLAALLLATIDNVDEVRWELPELPGEVDGSLDRAEADALVGSHVAELGATADGLRELVEQLERS